ncbi:hypothetical protein JB92DRAFT_3106186 [Gautieria morchelliformis]|nr:hypothetical protein JB92DRAFT_3106186 [Gautieria morchelliformis]
MTLTVSSFSPLSPLLTALSVSSRGPSLSPLVPRPFASAGSDDFHPCLASTCPPSHCLMRVPAAISSSSPVQTIPRRILVSSLGGGQYTTTIKQTTHIRLRLFGSSCCPSFSAAILPPVLTPFPPGFPSPSFFLSSSPSSSGRGNRVSVMVGS